MKKFVVNKRLKECVKTLDASRFELEIATMRLKKQNEQLDKITKK